MVAHRADPTRGCNCVSCRRNECSMEFFMGKVDPFQNLIIDLRNFFSMIPDPTHGATRCIKFDCDATAMAQSPPSNILNFLPWDSRWLSPENMQAIRSIRKQSHMEYCVTCMTKEVGLVSLPPNLVGSSTPHVWEQQHIKIALKFFLFSFGCHSNCR